MTKTQKYFYDQYFNVTENKYVANFGKDGKLFKSIEKIINEEEVKRLIDIFFSCNDEFIMRAGFTVGVFYSQINKLRNGLLSKNSQFSQTTMANIGTMKQWLKKSS